MATSVGGNEPGVLGDAAANAHIGPQRKLQNFPEQALECGRLVRQARKLAIKEVLFCSLEE